MNVAVDRYNSFPIAIDRPGIASSSIEDPLKVLQIPVELSVIYRVAEMLRTNAVQANPYSFSKTIHVGHSSGSSPLYNQENHHPTADDGLILTGFFLSEFCVGTAIAGFNSQIKNIIQPLRLGTQDNAAIVEVLAVLGAANKTLAFIKQHYPDLCATLADFRFAYPNLNLKDLVAGFEKPTLPTIRKLPTGCLMWEKAV